MKKITLLTLLLTLIFTSYTHAQQSDFYRQLRFEVTSQRDITPNAIEVTLQIQKKGSNPDDVAAKLERTLQRITQECKTFQLSDSDLSVQNNALNTVDWLFGKDFQTQTTVKLKIKSLKNWAALTKKVLQVDSDCKFVTVGYAYPDGNGVWDGLIQEATARVQSQKKQYEKQLGVTLSLVSLQERRFKPNNTPMPMLRKAMLADAQAQSIEEAPPLGLPVSPYQLTLEVGFFIEPKVKQ